jgi:hypothetical protein
MRATCRTLSPFTALRGTLATRPAFPRNEGVPGSSPGVGLGRRPAKRAFLVGGRGSASVGSGRAAPTSKACLPSFALSGMRRRSLRPSKQRAQ